MVNVSSAASKRPGEIVSVEQMFSNLHLFLVSSDTFLLLLAEAPSSRRAPMLFSARSLQCSSWGIAALCTSLPKPVLQAGKPRHAETPELSQLPGQVWATDKRFPRQVSHAGVAEPRSPAGALCPAAQGLLRAHQQLPLQLEHWPINHSEAPPGPEPWHPVWPLKSRLLSVAVIVAVLGPGGVKYGWNMEGNLTFSLIQPSVSHCKGGLNISVILKLFAGERDEIFTGT